jgi:hypothetical protein
MIQTDIFANVGRIFMIAGMKGISNGLAKPNGKTRRVSYGDGLVRMDRPGGTSSWVCRLQKHGVRRDFGLGSCQKVSLAQARELAREIRSQIALGNCHACPTPSPPPWSPLAIEPISMRIPDACRFTGISRSTL